MKPKMNIIYKRILFASILFYSLLFSLNLSAKSVELKTASQIAVNIFSEKSGLTVKSVKINEVIPVEKDGLVLYRIFNFKPTGYIIITADDNAEPVIGYGLNNNFNFDDAPPALLYLLDVYKKEMEAIIEKKIKADSAITEKWNKYSSLDFLSLKSYTPYSYLLETTWDQDGYNYYCPIDPVTGVRSSAGCSAVALAQILHYWGCRVFPDGTSSYTPENFTSPLTVNFYNQDYDWDAMDHSSSDADNQELIYHCGVAIKVKYTSHGTGGATSNANLAMKNYFGFQTTGVKWKTSYSSSTWINMLKNEINSGRPVYYQGYDTVGVDQGHAWVIDGYDYYDQFYCNWGWGGDYNGFYSLSNLNPWISLNIWQAGIFGAEPILDACSGFSGADEVCSSSNESYSVSIPSTASVVWSKTGAVNQVGGNTGTTYTVSYAYNDEATITATIKNSQGQTFLTRSKDVWVGEPHDLELYCEGRGDLYTYDFYVTPFYDYDSIVWGVYPAPAEINDHGYSGYATIYFDEPGFYDIWAYVANECGDGTYAYITDFYVSDDYFLLSPNPATNEVEVTVNDGIAENLKSGSLESGSLEDDEYTVTITDVNGITKSQKKYKGKRFTISVQHLKDGNYFVNLKNEKMNKTEQLIIKR